MRPLLAQDWVTPKVAERQAAFYADAVQEVARAIEEHPVVVVGMAWNPHVPRARRMLDAQGIAHVDLDYGNYLSGWRKRLAIKLWSGWPTFPQVFVGGTLIGGAHALKRCLEDGTVARLLTPAEGEASEGG